VGRVQGKGNYNKNKNKAAHKITYFKCTLGKEQENNFEGEEKFN
jgi:hypothetical protein